MSQLDRRAHLAKAVPEACGSLMTMPLFVSGAGWRVAVALAVAAATVDGRGFQSEWRVHDFSSRQKLVTRAGAS